VLEEDDDEGGVAGDDGVVEGEQAARVPLHDRAQLGAQQQRAQRLVAERCGPVQRRPLLRVAREHVGAQAGGEQGGRGHVAPLRRHHEGRAAERIPHVRQLRRLAQIPARLLLLVGLATASLLLPMHGMLFI